MIDKYIQNRSNTPNLEYPIRILEELRKNCIWVWVTNGTEIDHLGTKISFPGYEKENVETILRAKILDAINILKGNNVLLNAIQVEKDTQNSWSKGTNARDDLNYVMDYLYSNNKM